MTLWETQATTLELSGEELQRALRGDIGATAGPAIVGVDEVEATLLEYYGLDPNKFTLKEDTGTLREDTGIQGKPNKGKDISFHIGLIFGFLPGHFGLSIGNEQYGFAPDELLGVIGKGLIYPENELYSIKIPLENIGEGGTQTLLNLINQDITNPPRYNLFTFNCFIWAMSRYYIARDIGGDAPKIEYNTGPLDPNWMNEMRRREMGLPIPQR